MDKTLSKQSIGQPMDWLERSELWAIKSSEIRQKSTRERRDRKPIIICGFGASLRIDRGTLFIRNGFNYHPQAQDSFRYFRGDTHLPSRIIISDASGSISFDVMAWLAEQKIPLIVLNWAGEIITLANAEMASDPNTVRRQTRDRENGIALRKFRQLLSTKFRNSIATLKLIPEKKAQIDAIDFLQKADKKIVKNRAFTQAEMLGIEGEAAAKYFNAWNGIQILWKKNSRKIVPLDWHKIGWRRSALSKSNRNSRHPINSLLNYAYSVLFTEVKIQLIADGYDLKIGLSHGRKGFKEPLVLDHMEPLRPFVDAEILKLVLKDEFSPSDFVVTNEGFCRLNPQLAKVICQMVSARVNLSRTTN